MTILFASNDIDDFTVVGSPLTTTNTTYRDANYVPYAITIDSTESMSTSFTATGPTLWVHHRLYCSTSAFDNSPLLEFKSGGSDVARIAHRTSSATLWLQTKQGGTWTNVQDLGIATTSYATQVYIWDIKLVLGDSGSIDIWIDGASVVSFSGIDTNGDTGITTCDELLYDKASTSTAGDVYYSEFIVADEDTRDMRVFRAVPNAAGTNSDFTGAYTDIDEDQYSDGDFISSDTANQISTFGMANLPTDDLEVKAVTLSCRARRGATGPQSMQYALRVNVTEYFSDTKTLDTGFAQIVPYIWETSPDTAAAWTKAEIDALEIGAKSIT